jgi:hypothetical protein
VTLSPTPIHGPGRSRHQQPAQGVVTEILQTLDELGVAVEARPGGGLHYTPRKAVGARLRTLLIQYKPQLLEQLEKGAA